MAKDSIKDRLKITKNGKVKHRPTGESHSKSNKRASQKNRKKKDRELEASENEVKDLMNN